MKWQRAGESIYPAAGGSPWLLARYRATLHRVFSSSSTLVTPQPRGLQPISLCLSLSLPSSLSFSLSLRELCQTLAESLVPLSKYSICRCASSRFCHRFFHSFELRPLFFPSLFSLRNESPLESFTRSGYSFFFIVRSVFFFSFSALDGRVSKERDARVAVNRARELFRIALTRLEQTPLTSQASIFQCGMWVDLKGFQLELCEGFD